MVEVRNSRHGSEDPESFLKGECKVCYSLIDGVVKMCPKCSTFYCVACIDEFSKRKVNQCPICRQRIKISDYARCILAEEMIRDHLLNKNLRCKSHNLEKCYLCLEEGCIDSLPLCPECYFEGHSGHKRQKLTNVYEKNKTKVIQSLASLSTKIDQLVKAGLSADNEIINLKKTEKNQLGAAKSFF